MWPSSTCCLSGTQEARMARVSIAQARCGLLPLVHDGGEQEKSGRFNRSSAMWPSSTPGGRVARRDHGRFQSLKRDVAFFHPLDVERGDNHSRVSIAQARCGLLPHVVYKPELAEHEMVSIAQARGGLLPPGFRGELSYVRLVSIAQARCGLLPRGLRSHVRS